MALGAFVRAAMTAMFVLLVAFASGALQSFLFIDLDNPLYESPVARYAWLPVYGIALALMVFRLPHVFRLVTFAPLLVICVLIAGMSMMWSVDPAVTLRRAFALMMTTSLGLALAAWLSWSRLIQCVAGAFLILAVASYLIVIIDPGRGIMDSVYPGAWRGAWEQKNQLGGMMTKGFIAMLGALAVRPGRAWLWGPGCLLCLGLVIMSTSKTALLISMGALTLLVWLAAYRNIALARPVLWFGLITGVGTVVGALLFFPVETLGLIGKDPTFTGRTDIWTLLVEAIRAEPITGYGYGAFWLDPLGPSYQMRTILEWGVPSAHNGWFEIWLSAGVFIVLAFALHLLLTVAKALSRLTRGGREIYWVVLYTMAFIGFSLSESAILTQNDLTWVMFVAMSAKLLAGERIPRRTGHLQL